jgi:TATA-box binding protein (TBP) (component of TFIID and TFIIIB)
MKGGSVMAYKITGIAAKIEFKVRKRIDLARLEAALDEARGDWTIQYRYFNEAGKQIEDRSQASSRCLEITRPDAALILVFSTGKLAFGAFKSEQDFESARQKIIQLIEEAGTIFESDPEMTYVRTVAGGDLHRELDIIDLNSKLSPVKYDPEKFPGLIYDRKDLGVRFLLFGSGKFAAIFKGKSEEALGRAIQALRDQLDALR